MKFRVYETATDKDVTDKKEWYLDTNGILCYMTNDVDCALYMADGGYYYKLEVLVFQ